MSSITIITGATGGIGASCAVQLAQSGMRVIGTSHTQEGLQRLKKMPHFTDSYLLDLSSVASIYTTIAAIVENHGPVHVLVNNAATLLMADMFDVTEEIWDQTLNVNLKAIFFASQAVATYMKQLDHGVIINVASLAGKLGFSDQVPYSASKAGVLSLTRTMARELAAWNIRVHAVCPGAIDTSLFDHCLEWSQMKYNASTDELRQSWLGATVNRSMIAPQHVADVIDYLVTRGSMSLSGCCWDVDSGVSQ